MGYSTRVAERRGRVHADANGDTPNALAKQQSFCAGLDHQCDDGDSEGISTVKGPEDSSRSVPEGGRASRWNSRDKIAEPPMDELAILSESQQIAQICQRRIRNVRRAENESARAGGADEPR